MEKQTWSAIDSKRVELFLIVCVVLFVLFRLFGIVSIDHIPNVTATYMIPMFILAGTLVWIRKGRPRDIEMILLMAFAVWLAVTRVLNGDKYLHESYVYVSMIGFACLVLYPLPGEISEKSRKQLFTAVALVFGVAMGIAAWAGVIAVLTKSPISNPFNVHVLGLYETSRLWLFTNHPNGFACLLYIALSMLFYLAVTIKRLWVRLLFAVLAIGLCLAIYFTGCNAGIVITIVILLMMAFLLMYQNAGISRKSLLTICVALLIMVLIMAGALYLYNTSTAGSDTQTGPEQVFGTRFDEAPSTFASRVNIWKAGFRLLQEKPLRFLIGDLRTPVRLEVAEDIGVYLTHMHNSYMEVLMTSGIPALLMMLAFNILLFYRSVKLFLCRQAPLASRILTLPLFGLLVHAVTENYIFTEELQSMLFFLIAGMVVFESRKWCPAKRVPAASR